MSAPVVERLSKLTDTKRISVEDMDYDHNGCTACGTMEGPFLLTDSSGGEYGDYVLCESCIAELFSRHKAWKVKEQAKPQFEHDSNCCTFLGRYNSTYDRWEGDYDLYYCDQGGRMDTVIARWGNAGPQYMSGISEIVTGEPFPNRDSIPPDFYENYPLRVAYQRAVERGLITPKEGTHMDNGTTVTRSTDDAGTVISTPAPEPSTTGGNPSLGQDTAAHPATPDVSNPQGERVVLHNDGKLEVLKPKKAGASEDTTVTDEQDDCH